MSWRVSISCAVHSRDTPRSRQIPAPAEELHRTLRGPPSLAGLCGPGSPANSCLRDGSQREGWSMRHCGRDASDEDFDRIRSRDDRHAEWNQR